MMIRRAAKYADFGVERLLAASYFGATVAEGFAETRTLDTRIIREVDGWDPLTTKVLMATWAAPYGAMPHSIPNISDELRDGREGHTGEELEGEIVALDMSEFVEDDMIAAVGGPGIGVGGEENNGAEEAKG